MAYPVVILRSQVLDSEFMPLAEYQSSTPASFDFEENPVLYYKATGVSVTLSNPIGKLRASAAFTANVYVASS
jgi:hypothetical protein